MDFSYVHIRYFIGYVYHICLQDTIQSSLSLCQLCQAMLLPMPLRPLLLTTRSGFRPKLKLTQKSPKLTSCSDPPEVGTRQLTLCPSSTNSLEHSPNLVPSEVPASGQHG